MTVEQVYQKWNNKFHLEGNNGGIQKHKHYILEMMKEYARLMCDKQKEICAKETQTKVYLEFLKSILNAPYPDELQGNN